MNPDGKSESVQRSASPVVEEDLGDKTRLIIDAALDAIISINLQGAITLWNPQAEALFGWSRSEAIEQPLSQLLIPERFRERHNIGFQRYLETGEAHTLNKRIEIFALHRSGEEIPIELIITPIRNGENLFFVSFMRDLRERREAERRVRESEEKQRQLEEKAKLLQKEMTAAVIQAQEGERAQLGQELHDNVNQVLTTVKLYLGMLHDGMGNPTELIAHSVSRLQQCINEIRSISKRLSAPSLGKISLSESIHELVASINLTERVHIRFRMVAFHDDDISQPVHLGLYRIVQEAINNSLKYAEADSVMIGLVRVHNDVQLIISDNGVGFAPGGRKSNGIGITNMRTRAEHLNGSFVLDSAPGRGTKIKVSIPLSQQKESVL